MHEEVRIKAISLKQPWANLVASGKKTIETRTWKTPYSGPILIVSSKKRQLNQLDMLWQLPIWSIAGLWFKKMKEKHVSGYILGPMRGYLRTYAL